MRSLKSLNPEPGSTYPLPYYSIFAAETLRYVVIFTSDPVTLTFEFWPWTCVVRRLCRGQTLYQIWTQWSNLRRSYCDFNIWPNDLEHVALVAIDSGIIFTKFELGQPICSWLTAFLAADTLCHVVTLIFDPLTFKLLYVPVHAELEHLRAWWFNYRMCQIIWTNVDNAHAWSFGLC